jgi:hypothetical protein
MRCHRRVGGMTAAAIAATVFAGGTALAQTTASSDNVAAEALFEDARTLVAAGKYAEACPKFADSERLGPSASTLLNLANCWEKVGRTATAWATYREAASVANATGRKDYLATALRRADGLAPKLARLTVTVVQSAPGLQIKRDGVVVDPAEWGAGIPVDVGSHSVEATAPGRKAWVVAIQVAQDGAQASVAVPALEELPVEAPPVAPAPVVAPPATSAASAPPVAETPGSGRGQRVIGAALAGLGVVGLGVGGVFALIAKSKNSDSLGNCSVGVLYNDSGYLPSGPNSCNTAGVSERNAALTDGNVATVGLSVGAVALVAGAVLWFTAPHGSAHPEGAASFQIAPTLGGISARGAW